MKLTIELTEEEYAELERRAKAERRSPEQMAEWLVTRPVPVPVEWNKPIITYPSQLLPGMPGGPPAVLSSSASVPWRNDGQTYCGTQ